MPQCQGACGGSNLSFVSYNTRGKTYTKPIQNVLQSGSTWISSWTTNTARKFFVIRKNVYSRMNTRAVRCGDTTAHTFLHPKFILPRLLYTTFFPLDFKSVLTRSWPVSETVPASLQHCIQHKRTWRSAVSTAYFHNGPAVRGRDESCTKRTTTGDWWRPDRSVEHYDGYIHRCKGGGGLDINSPPKTHKMSTFRSGIVSLSWINKIKFSDPKCFFFFFFSYANGYTQ